MTRSHYHEKIEKKLRNTRSTEQNVLSVFFCVLQSCVIEMWKVPNFPTKSKQNISTISTCFAVPKFGVSISFFRKNKLILKRWGKPSKYSTFFYIACKNFACAVANFM